MEALVVGKAPVEDVQFDRFHSVQIAFDCRDRYKAVPGVNQQTSPRKARLVINRNDGNAEAFWSDSHQLEESLESAEHSDWIGGRQLNIGRRDFEVVGFILTELLNCGARSSSLHYEVRLIVDCFAPERNSGLAGKCVQEALPCPFETSFLIALQSDAKIPVNREFAFALHNVRGQRHDGQRAFFLRANNTGKI